MVVPAARRVEIHNSPIRILLNPRGREEIRTIDRCITRLSLEPVAAVIILH